MLHPFGSEVNVKRAGMIAESLTNGWMVRGKSFADRQVPDPDCVVFNDDYCPALEGLSDMRPSVFYPLDKVLGLYIAHSEDDDWRVWGSGECQQSTIVEVMG